VDGSIERAGPHRLVLAAGDDEANPLRRVIGSGPVAGSSKSVDGQIRADEGATGDTSEVHARPARTGTDVGEPNAGP